MKNRLIFPALILFFVVAACSKPAGLNQIVADDTAGDSVFVGYGTVEVLKRDFFRDYYVSGLDNYRPSDTLIGQLRPLLDQVRFRVVLGTWESRSQKTVPLLFNVLFSVGNYDPTLRSNVELVGVDRKMGAPDVDVKSLNVKRLPLIIVFRGDKEIGRMSGKINKPMEQALLDILNNSK